MFEKNRSSLVRKGGSAAFLFKKPLHKLRGTPTDTQPYVPSYVSHCHPKRFHVKALFDLLSVMIVQEAVPTPRMGTVVLDEVSVLVLGNLLLLVRVWRVHVWRVQEEDRLVIVRHGNRLSIFLLQDNVLDAMSLLDDNLFAQEEMSANESVS